MSKTYKLTHFRHDHTKNLETMRDYADTKTDGVSVSVGYEAYNGFRIEHTFEAQDEQEKEQIVSEILSNTPFLVYNHTTEHVEEETLEKFIA